MGRYLVTGFWITRKSFSRLLTAVTLNFCNNCTAKITKVTGNVNKKNRPAKGNTSTPWDICDMEILK